MIIRRPRHCRRHALYSVWAITLLFAFAACDPEEDNPSEGDDSVNCMETKSCGSVQNGDYLAMYDFIPNGVFAIKTVSGDSARLVAKNLDGSLITADVNWNEQSDNYKTVSKWKIWHEEMYYWVNHDLIGDKENKTDRWYTLSLKYPGSSAADPKELSIDTPWGGFGSGIVGSANPFMLYYNFTNLVNFRNKDEVVFEKDDVVAGIPCKKYTFSTEFSGFITKREWWVLDNGFCLKHNYWNNGELAGVESFEVVLAELDTETYDAVTQKYARFRNQIKAEIPPVAEMLKATEGVAGGEWIAPAGFIPWTAGGIDFMVNFRALNWENYPVHEVHVKFKEGTDLKDATEAYKADIMSLPSMRELDDSGCINVSGYDMGCIWKYNNQTDECGDDYSYSTYKINTQGAGGEGVERTPSTPSEIFMRFTPVICV